MSDAGRSRSHHYVPQFYLRLFAQKHRRKHLLWVFDLEKGRVFRSTPRSVAAKNDYFTFYGSDGPDDTAELIRANVERAIAPGCQRAADTTCAMLDEDLAYTLWLAAMVFSAQPAHRAVITSGMRRLADMTSLLMNSPSPVEIPPPSGGTSISMDPDEFVAWASDDHALHNSAVRSSVSVESHTGIAKMLIGREWCRMQVNLACGQLLTSDDPVSIIWMKLSNHGREPGLIDDESLVVFPLSPTAVLYGTFDCFGTNRVLDRDSVAKVNHLIVSRARRFVFARSKRDLPFLGRDGQTSNFADLFEEYCTARAEAHTTDGHES